MEPPSKVLVFEGNVVDPENPCAINDFITGCNLDNFTGICKEVGSASASAKFNHPELAGCIGIPPSEDNQVGAWIAWPGLKKEDQKGSIMGTIFKERIQAAMQINDEPVCVNRSFVNIYSPEGDKLTAPTGPSRWGAWDDHGYVYIMVLGELPVSMVCGKKTIDGIVSGDLLVVPSALKRKVAFTSRGKFGLVFGYVASEVEYAPKIKRNKPKKKRSQVSLL